MHICCPTCNQRVPQIDEEDELLRELIGNQKYTLYLRNKRFSLRSVDKYTKAAREKIWKQSGRDTTGLFDLLIAVEILKKVITDETNKKLLLNGDSKV